MQKHYIKMMKFKDNDPDDARWQENIRSYNIGEHLTIEDEYGVQIDEYLLTKSDVPYTRMTGGYFGVTTFGGTDLQAFTKADGTFWCEDTEEFWTM